MMKHLIRLIQQNKDKIKSGEKGGAKSQVFGDSFRLIVVTTDWVSSCEDGRSGGQRTHNSRLCDADGLLLHGL